MKPSKRLSLLLGLALVLGLSLGGLQQLLSPAPAAAADWQLALSARLLPAALTDANAAVDEIDAAETAEELEAPPHELRPALAPPPGPLITPLWDSPAYASPADAEQALTLDRGLSCYLLEAYAEPDWHLVQYRDEQYYLPAAAVDLSGYQVAYQFHRGQDMRVRTGFTAEQLELCLSGAMSGLGQAFAEAEAAYGVNALFMIAICQHESANGESGLARSQNNLMGLRAGSGWASFDSFGDCVAYLGEYLNSYYLPPDAPWHHGSTIAGVAATYCNSSPAWVEQIGNYMEKDLALIQAE